MRFQRKKKYFASICSRSMSRMSDFAENYGHRGLGEMSDMVGAAKSTRAASLDQ